MPRKGCNPQTGTRKNIMPRRLEMTVTTMLSHSDPYLEARSIPRGQNACHHTQIQDNFPTYYTFCFAFLLQPQIITCPYTTPVNARTPDASSAQMDLVENLGEVLSPLLLKPGHGVLLCHPLPEAHTGLAELPLGDADTRTLHHHVEIHTVNTGVGIIFDTKIDVLRDTETPVPILGEVLAAKLELLHGKTLGNDVLGLVPTHSDVRRDLLVTPDTESTHGVPSYMI